MPPVYQGNTTPREIFSSNELNRSAGQKGWVKRWQGLFAELIDLEPEVGSLMEGDNRYSVDSVQTVPTKGRLGEMTVSYIRYLNLETISPTSTMELEISWIKEDVPFTAMVYVAGQDMQDVIARIDDYVNSRSVTERETIRTEIEGWGAVATRLLLLRLAGITSFQVSRPCVRRTEEYVLRSSAVASIGAAINKHQVPQNLGTATYPTTYSYTDVSTGTPTPATDTWFYVCTDDKVSRTGRSKKWKRYQEWQGFYLPTNMQANVRAAVVAMYPDA
jgi:hypothetical protein